MTSELNNIEQKSDTLNAKYHAMFHFISDSNWDARSARNGMHTSLVDASLYLPTSWISDSERSKKAQIPIEDRVFKTK